MNESKAENIFIKDVRAQGGVAVKLRHRFMAGLPDLFIKMPSLGGVFIECKYALWPRRETTIALKLTPLQRNFLSQMQNVGQPAGWLLFTTPPVDIASPVPSCIVGADPDQRECDATDVFRTSLFGRPRGTTWDIRGMMLVVIGRSE